MNLPRLWIVLAASIGLGQSQNVTQAIRPTFEVASIKQSADPPGSSRVHTTNGRAKMENVTLKQCLRSAYDLQDAQILGGPKWIDDDRYYIEAKATGPAKDRELMIMLQDLLVERFKLVFHRETRDFAGYALVMGKGGLKAKPSDPNSSSRGNFTGRNSRLSLNAARCTMTWLAQKLSETLHMPVVDLTKIDGAFDFKLEWVADELQVPVAVDVSGPSIFAALQEQLGLRLESRKIPTDVLVIDGAERPSEN